MTEATTLALVAIVGAAMTALFKLLADNTTAQARNAEAMAALVDETRKGNHEAAQRNGHLGAQNVQITEMIGTMTGNMTKLADRNYKASIECQHIKEQTVDNQTVINETVEGRS